MEFGKWTLLAIITVIADFWLGELFASWRARRRAARLGKMPTDGSRFAVAPRFFGPYYIVALDGTIVSGPHGTEPEVRAVFAAKWWEQPGHFIVRVEGIVIAGAVIEREEKS